MAPDRVLDLLAEIDKYLRLDFPACTDTPCRLLRVAAEALRQSQEARQCTWRFDDGYDGESWDTSCGEKFVFIDGGPIQNSLRFCCYCGGQMIEARPAPVEDPDEEPRGTPPDGSRT